VIAKNKPLKPPKRSEIASPPPILQEENSLPHSLIVPEEEEVDPIAPPPHELLASDSPASESETILPFTIFVIFVNPSVPGTAVSPKVRK